MTEPSFSSVTPSTLPDQSVDKATARHVVLASFLAWMLDACDFFIVLFRIERECSGGVAIGLTDVRQNRGHNACVQ